MSIIRKEKDLPKEMQELLGSHFVPSERKDVWYVRSSMNPQSLIKVAFYMFLPVTICSLILFLSVIYSSFTKEFRSEGFFIALIIFIFSAGVQSFIYLFVRKYKKLTEKIASGERKFGLWVTPTYIMSNDHNVGIECVAKKEVESMYIYASGRPRVDMVVLVTKNKQKLMVVADWLLGYYNKVELLLEHLKKSIL